MKAVIFGGGDIENYEKVKKYLSCCSIVICADSGARHAFNMGVVPDLLVGDMDSISPADMEKVQKWGVKKQNFPSEKDFTDTELAVCEALKLGADEALLLGGLGNRPDHSLANIFLMVSFKQQGLELKLADGNWEMFLIDEPVEIEGKEGDILSLVPITPKVTGVTTEGLYYPLKGETLLMGPARGISNVFLTSAAKVEIEQGLLLAVKCTEDEI
ncbi:Thiamine pyrophosphokinase [Tepidanaerobacter acetatoxydans Re1]|uniref:Thiamine diphosphokinase n=1 Tax=Tepidanaerobacter acetatoxydans (strain DSM 21804 / JCM 16047 / Re1) TaxID=1209989 RepID=F4LRT8_TEPAE|nr:thiamine diphosphokinase [Tepidanaerobacter acetatoxydans]AEE91156.1 thiamine pyrophosphokinase [Tepidanaerobacter acetatoxydans Re1]CCP25822.1 Thiamine pyrophosphokinase [Tepidanaerobacter acetatoxydans Re1]